MTEYAFNVETKMLHILPCTYTPTRGSPTWVYFPDSQAAKQWLQEYNIKPVLCSRCYTEIEWRKIK